MLASTWSLFLAVSLAAVLSPGPAMLAILGHALARGSRATVPVVLGNVSGAVLLIGASIAGLSALLAALPHGLLVLKLLGSAYLAWLGARAWRAAPQEGDDPRPPAAEPQVRKAYGHGVLIALSNPKALLFFGAVLPQFVDAKLPVAPQFAIMAATFAALELASNLAVTLAAQTLSPFLRRAPVARRVNRAGGAVMIAAAALLALSPARR